MAGNRFTQGKRAIAECDRCGFQFLLKQLKPLTIKTKIVDVRVCPSCWEKDHPQLMLGMYPVDDPQAIRNPRRDNTYWQAGLTGIRTRTRTLPPDNVLAFGTPSGGSRIIQWGWNPVGLNDILNLTGLEDVMEMHGAIGFVKVMKEEIFEVTGVQAAGAVAILYPTADTTLITADTTAYTADNIP